MFGNYPKQSPRLEGLFVYALIMKLRANDSG